MPYGPLGIMIVCSIVAIYSYAFSCILVKGVIRINPNFKYLQLWNILYAILICLGSKDTECVLLFMSPRNFVRG